MSSGFGLVLVSYGFARAYAFWILSRTYILWFLACTNVIWILSRTYILWLLACTNVIWILSRTYISWLLACTNVFRIFAGNLRRESWLVFMSCGFLFTSVLRSFLSYLYLLRVLIHRLPMSSGPYLVLVCVCVLLLLLLFCFYKLLFIFSTTWYLAGDRRHMFTKDTLETQVCIIQG